MVRLVSDDMLYLKADAESSPKFSASTRRASQSSTPYWLVDDFVKADVDSATEIDPTQRKARSEGHSPVTIHAEVVTSMYAPPLSAIVGAKPPSGSVGELLLEVF